MTNDYNKTETYEENTFISSKVFHFIIHFQQFLYLIWLKQPR